MTRIRQQKTNQRHCEKPFDKQSTLLCQPAARLCGGMFAVNVDGGAVRCRRGGDLEKAVIPLAGVNVHEQSARSVGHLRDTFTHTHTVCVTYRVTQQTRRQRENLCHREGGRSSALGAGGCSISCAHNGAASATRARRQEAVTSVIWRPVSFHSSHASIVPNSTSPLHANTGAPVARRRSPRQP